MFFFVTFKNPIDLSTIQLRINKKVYKSRSEFCNDMVLIVHNCLKYNGDDSCKKKKKTFCILNLGLHDISKMSENKCL